MSRSLPLKSVNEPTTKWDFFSNAGAICGCVSSRHKWLISVPTEMKPGSAGLHPWLLYQASTMQTFAFSEFFFFLLKHTPLERCCVHKMSPFISSNGLSPGSRDAKVQRAKVCLTCTEPTVARSSYWSLPVGQYLSDSRCKGSVVIIVRWTASNMAEEPQTSISHQVRKRWTTSGSSDFHIWHVVSIRYPHDLA